MSFSAASLHAALETAVPADAIGLVVALSGGPDSAALLAAAAALGKNSGNFRGLPLRALHIDHGLQAAAAEFRKNCQALCDRLGVPLSVMAIEVHGEAGASVEAAARAARYAALASQLRPGECLLTAHHREDQAETLLLQALRGAGIKGMSAMPICREFGPGWHVRPLLDVAGNDLRQFAAHLQKFQSVDPMNEDLRFDRVHLRKEIWPPVERRWPGAGIALSRAACHLAEAQLLLDILARADVARLRDGDELSVPGLRCLTPLKRANAVRLWLSEKGLEPPSTARLGEALRQILDAEEDQQPAIVWGGKALRRYRQRMFVTDADPPRLEAQPWVARLGSSIELGPQLGRLTWVAQIGGIAPHRLPATLAVRRRSGGETLKPAPLARTQSVQHLCQSWGVLPWMRDALPLVFAGDELIAIADMWAHAGWSAAEGPGLRIEWSGAPNVT
jgi:tRNA(Ile)-lysidine synthase